MMDRAVGEYADLVRALERRQSLPSSPPPPPPPKESPALTAATSNGKHTEKDGDGVSTLEALRERKEELRKLAGEFEGASEVLRDEIGKLRGELEEARTELEAERKAAEEERARLSNALTELELLKHDDNAAAKMVSRYMYALSHPLAAFPTNYASSPRSRKFSQTTTDTLQKSLESLAARHVATTSTLHTQLASAQTALATERRQTARLRDVLDEATEQLARETYGRRREIALRLAVVGREDQLAEALRRWVRRAQETLAREDVPAARQRLGSIVGDAGELLALVDGAAPREDAGLNLGPGVGSVARIMAARDAAAALVEELRVETERRMLLERILGHAEVDEEGRVVPQEPLTPSSTTNSACAHVATKAAAPVLEVTTKVDAAISPICPCPSPLALAPHVSAQVTKSSPEDPVSSSEPSPQPADLPVGSIDIPTTVTVLHQPTPRSAVGSPAFLSPRSSPSSSPTPVTIPEDAHSTLPTSLPLQDTILPTTNESDTTGSSSFPDPVSALSLPSSGQYSRSCLVTELEKTKTRYDELQRAFRDCHLALRDLRQTLQILPPSSSFSSSSVPISALQTIIARLDDFNEDARVELEIRIADEERIARGYATLLAVPGAIASEAEAQEVERAVRAFIEGSGDETVARAQSKFARKRDDLEHDVAALKWAVHELSQQPPTQAQTQAPSSPSPSSSPRPATPTSWTSLAAGIFASGGGGFSSSRPASPSPTFGAVVTSPRARRAVSGEAGPIFTLQQQLRIPMPELHQAAATSVSSLRPGPRPRTTSGMYMLGLGMRGGVGVEGRNRSPWNVQDASDFEVE
jgi:hypothetical protein